MPFQARLNNDRKIVCGLSLIIVHEIVEYREYCSIKLCITSKFLEIRDIAQRRVVIGGYTLEFVENWLWVLIKILYIFSLSCKVMMF